MSSAASNQWVYSFGPSGTDGRASMKNLLGGKGANLAEMAHLGLPVPAGFTISTEVCSYFVSHKNAFPVEFEGQVRVALAEVEKEMNCEFGSNENPLLLSVRSGARVSMPGMMDTVLNLGLNDGSVESIGKKFGDMRFAFDSYRRFIQMYSDIVLGINLEEFESILQLTKNQKGVSLDIDLDENDLRSLVVAYKEKCLELTGKPFPQDPWEQLWGSISAVFLSWNNKRAITYRRINRIPENWGTAVNVMSMVFGNLGPTSATGVAFTRDPGTGERIFFGEYLVQAQGEDVVAGIRTPQPITIESKLRTKSNLPAMEEVFPEVFLELMKYQQVLETHFRDMQDLEFTVQDGKLWMLQTRNGKRTASAAVRMAVEMFEEGLISRDDALLRVDPRSLDKLLHRTIDPNQPKQVLAVGLPASPGAASGRVVFSAEEAEHEHQADPTTPVLLVRIETSPDDIHGMHVSAAILTSRGGMTSHAAVVARGMGCPCVAGCGDLVIDYESQYFEVKGVAVRKGDWITIDGSTGEVFLGKMKTLDPQVTGHFARLMEWADQKRRLEVHANAETLEDAQAARDFGAQGIGLSRTEHMFFNDERIHFVRHMILASCIEEQNEALRNLLPFQQNDFFQLFKIMSGFPITIRFLDPPLHEFLPHTYEEMEDLSKRSGIRLDLILERSEALKELNPMLGLRGCRLGLTHPDIYRMQAEAVFRAAIDIVKNGMTPPLVEIMIPLVLSRRELEICKAIVDETAERVFLEAGIVIHYRVGSMIELPRAALRAGDIAEIAEFFSFGTNDLTQMTLGISRDDSGKFLEDYRRQGVFDIDPFMSLDVDGVGELIEIAVQRGRAKRPELTVGICGEVGGDPDTILFCERMKLDYVSCSPYRVPIARLAAAQAAIKEQQRVGN